MNLSCEDSLQLHVLIANSVAIRIDEGTMQVYGLSGTGDTVRVSLSPNCRADRYIRNVREVLSSTILGSPGGYPVFLKRWTRMGQAGGSRLADLMMLGEPEAVVAVTGAMGLTDELARYAWWSMPDSDNARRMLQQECVVQGEMGKVLAEFLLEFLPFEEEPQAIIESVRLILQPGLIDEAGIMSIWSRGKQKSVFLVGFLLGTPDALPESQQDRSDFDEYRNKLGPLSRTNPFAMQLLRLLSSSGQSFIYTCRQVLKKPSNQDVVVKLLSAITGYLGDVRISPQEYEDVESVICGIKRLHSGESEEGQILPLQVNELKQTVPELLDEIDAMLVLAHTDENIVRPIFARTDSIGSVMRKKLEPVSRPIMEQFTVLMNGR